ncbi:MAG: pimeloyl-ACP methyl ester carboxylesterase [Cyclobacteriaceae bacterium]|jgi:pimeloyl-ACP methyl ester carboxylesterase
MKYIYLTLVLSTIIFETAAQDTKTAVYLIPGQGSDHRLFQDFELGDSYNIRFINYSVPDEGMSMSDYAQTLSSQIDTGHPFILIGVSLGGMLSVELSELYSPEKVIIISSAKSRNELPARYRFQDDVPLYELVSGEISKKGALLLQPIVEPDRNKQKDIFVSMLNDKDPDFLKRTIAMIIEWDRTSSSDQIIHIHGDNDHTIPVRNVKYDYLIEGGSHMMALTRSKEISALILKILNEN